jgi:hypothetical protein
MAELPDHHRFPARAMKPVRAFRKDVCFMKSRKVLLFLIFLTVAAGACRDPHSPNIPSPPEEENDGRDEPEVPGFVVPISPPA